VSVNTGLAPIGRVDWGSHFCHFYRDEADMAETLVPYFKAGLESNEACLWVTAAPFTKEAALAQLRTYFSDIDTRIAAGQLVVLEHSEWYERVGRRSRADVVGMWVEAKNKALHHGYGGLRLSGNTAFLRQEDWDDFNDYENAVRTAFGSEQILALCSYQADRWDAGVVLDIVQTHDFALARRRGTWEIIESASVKKTKEALLALNAELERRVGERTESLRQTLSQQKMLTAELSHRVKNSFASVQAIVDQTLRRAASAADARVNVAGRLRAMARAHDQLAAGDWSGVSLRQAAETAATAFGHKVRIEVREDVLTPRAALGLSLVFHELMTNAVKYGALRSEHGSVTLRAQATPEGQFIITWSEQGGPAVDVPTHEGFGTRLMRELITHDLHGECELAFDPAGVRFVLRAPAHAILARGPECGHGCTH
jgi:two-component system, sensor histidine kinase PdtaS